MRLLTLLLLLACGSLAAQPLDGAYHGDLNGTPATLTLQQDGPALRGAIDAGGYGYALSGTVSGSGGEGTLTDPQAGSAMPFELAAQGSALTLTILATDPYGQVQRIPFSFQRAGGSGSPGAATPPSPGPPAGAEANVQRDPALVGMWSYSNTYNSGDFSGTTRLQMQVNPDGTYLYGGGGVSISGDSGSGRSGSGDVTRGEWRTEGNIVHVRGAGSPQWTPYARYYIEGGQMLFTFGDGSRQVWTRQ